MLSCVRTRFIADPYSFIFSIRVEVNLGPWQEEFKNIKKGSLVMSWDKKFPYAYWKGNPDVSSPTREKMVYCNDTKKWGAQILRQVHILFIT